MDCVLRSASRVPFNAAAVRTRAGCVGVSRPLERSIPLRRLGQIVEWISSSSGVTRTKRGEIVEVVQAHGRPRSMATAFGQSRNHESYIVRAIALRDANGNARKYWPLVSQLREVIP